MSSNAYLVETLGRAIGERDRRIAALEAEVEQQRQRAERAEEASRAALYLLGTDADRAAIGPKPWGQRLANAVIDMLRAAAGIERAGQAGGEGTA